MKENEKLHALSLYDNGQAEYLYKYIRKFIEERDPYALYLYSTFSLAEWNETAEEHDERRVSLLEEASAECSEAAYQLACIYLYGEGVPRDLGKAEQYACLSLEPNNDKTISLFNSILKMRNKKIDGIAINFSEESG